MPIFIEHLSVMNIGPLFLHERTDLVFVLICCISHAHDDAATFWVCRLYPNRSTTAGSKYMAIKFISRQNWARGECRILWNFHHIALLYLDIRQIKETGQMSKAKVLYVSYFIFTDVRKARTTMPSSKRFMRMTMHRSISKTNWNKHWTMKWIILS